jgi:hypothetical protein
MPGRDGNPTLMRLGEQSAKVCGRDTCIDCSGQLMKHHIVDEKPDEVCDISALFGSEAPPQRLSRGQKRRAKREATAKATDKPYAEIHNGEQATVLMDSGAVGRNFVTRACCDRLNLNIYRLQYPIKINSIHGYEIATEVARAQVKIYAQGEEVDLKWVEMVVASNLPKDIVIGLYTLRDQRVFSRLSRFFNTGQADGETREKTDEGPRLPISRKRVKVALTALELVRRRRELSQKPALRSL